MKEEMHMFEKIVPTHVQSLFTAIQDGEKTTYVFRKVVVNRKLSKSSILLQQKEQLIRDGEIRPEL